MNKYQLFRIFLFSIIIGVFYGTLYFNIVLSIVLLGLTVVIFFLKYPKHLLLAITIGFLVGFLRAGLPNIIFDLQDNMQKIAKNQTVNIKGVISDEPIMKNGKVRYYLNDVVVDGKSKNGKILFKYFLYPRFAIGQHLEIQGELILPEKFGKFDYKEYLIMKGVYVILNNPKIVKIGVIPSSPKTYLFGFKKIMEEQTNKIFQSPYNGFLNGLLYGSRSGMPKEVMDNFQTTSLTHIIAISGYNITLIISIFLSALFFIPRKTRLIIAGIFIVIFTIFVGADASVVRACIMGIIALLALHTGRTGEITTTLLIVATVMVMVNYRVLVFDVGFQLSFAATIGLVYISPFIEKYFLWITNTMALRESLLLTISAQITTLPLIVFNFGNLSLISPIANLFVAPFIPIAMFIGFVAVVVSFVSFYLGTIIGYGAYLALKIILFVANYFANLKYAAIQIENIPFIWFIPYYVLLVFVIMDLRERELKISD